MSDTTDEIVDRVVRGLRNAAPPDGMESRIANTLQDRACAKSIPNRPPWRKAALAGSAVAASVVCALLLIPHSRTPQASLPRSKAAFMQAVNGPILPPLSAKLATHKQAIRKISSASALPPKGDLAVVSFPAPPMPLTDQEKLLLRLAHRGDPLQLAMLDPQQRAKRNAAEKAEFQQFFEPSTLGDPE